MILNLIAIAFLVGLFIALNLTTLLPVFVIRFLTKTGLFRSGYLGYEKYEHTDSENRTSKRSRYFCRDAENFKTTCTFRIQLIMIAVCVLAFELVTLGLYFLVAH